MESHKILQNIKTQNKMKFFENLENQPETKMFVHNLSQRVALFPI